jgi:hypothetical protein
MATSSQTMRSVQRFNETGKLGILLLLASPLASGASYAWLLSGLADESARTSSIIGPSLLLIICSLAFLIGAIAVLIGRELITTVTTADPV